MRIEKHTRKLWNAARKCGYYTGSQPQPRTETVEYLKVYGTLDELIEYSYSKSIILERCQQTEHLFPRWDADAKYIMIRKGEGEQFADTLGDFSPYDTRGFIEEA